MGLPYSFTHAFGVTQLVMGDQIYSKGQTIATADFWHCIVPKCPATVIFMEGQIRTSTMHTHPSDARQIAYEFQENCAFNNTQNMQNRPIMFDPRYQFGPVPTTSGVNMQNFPPLNMQPPAAGFRKPRNVKGKSNKRKVAPESPSASQPIQLTTPTATATQTTTPTESTTKPTATPTRPKVSATTVFVPPPEHPNSSQMIPHKATPRPRKQHCPMKYVRDDDDTPSP